MGRITIDDLYQTHKEGVKYGFLFGTFFGFFIGACIGAAFLTGG